MTTRKRRQRTPPPPQPREPEIERTEPVSIPHDIRIVVDVLDALISVNRAQIVKYRDLQAVALSNNGDDGSHEMADLTRLGKRKIRYVNALTALMPLPTGPNGEAIGTADPLPAERT